MSRDGGRVIALFGTPSHLTARVLRLVQTVIQETVGPYRWIAAGTVDDVNKAVAERTHETVLLFGDIPASDLVDAVLAAALPIAVVLEPPAAIVDAVAHTRDIHGLAALRFASQSLATLHDLVLDRRTLVIEQDAADRPLSDVIGALTRLYGLPVDAGTDRKVLAGLGLQSSGREATLQSIQPADAASGDGAAPEFLALAETALAGFDPLPLRGTIDRFDWPPAVFIADRPKEHPATIPVKLIGHRRCFIYGPFFHLPRGSWLAEIELSVSGNHSGNILKIDVYTDRVIWEGMNRIPVSARLRCRVPIENAEPRLPVQLRLFNQQGAIEGEVVLHSVVVTRVVPGSSTAPDQLIERIER